MIFHTPEEFFAGMKPGDVFWHVPFTWGEGFWDVTGPHPFGKFDALRLHQGDQVTATNFREAHDYMETLREKQESDPDLQRVIREQRSMDASSDRTLEVHFGIPMYSLENEGDEDNFMDPPSEGDQRDDLNRIH